MSDDLIERAAEASADELTTDRDSREWGLAKSDGAAAIREYIRLTREQPVTIVLGTGYLGIGCCEFADGEWGVDISFLEERHAVGEKVGPKAGDPVDLTKTILQFRVEDSSAAQVLIEELQKAVAKDASLTRAEPGDGGEDRARRWFGNPLNLLVNTCNDGIGPLAAEFAEVRREERERCWKLATSGMPLDIVARKIRKGGGE